MSRLRELVAYLLVATLACLAPAAVHAQGAPNSIDGLNVTSRGGQTLLRLTLKEPLKNPPASFTVANPARIAFDFPNTINALARTSQEVNEGELRSVNLVQVGERTLYRWVSPTHGFLSQSERAVTFGLGDASAITELRITWPGGERQTVRNLKVDSAHVIRQSESN